MVPTDIVDHILSLLHTDQDYTSLETCSTVFPQLVDRHLYSQITLDVVDGGLVSMLPLMDVFYHRFRHTYYIVDPTDFFHILGDRPHVANYVRLVQIIIGHTRRSEDQLNYNLILQRLENRFSFTSSILSILPHPESIVVERHDDRLTSWQMLSSEFCTAFQNSVRLSSVKSVDIFNMFDLSLDCFDDCKNLENLLLNGSFLHGDSVSTSPYPRLCSLHIDDDNITRAVSWLKNNTLHTLSLRPRGGSIPSFRALIEACATTLVNLDVNHNYNPIDDSTLSSAFPDLHLPLLDHLTFHSPLDGPHWTNLSPLSLLVPFLGSIKTLSPLSPIRLTLHLNLDRSDPDWSLVTPVLTLPIFCHPIELYFSDVRAARDRDSMGDVISLLEQNSDMKRLLDDGKLVAFMNEEWPAF